MLIVENCELDEDFQFFNERQRNYLKSMIASPIKDLCLDGVNPVQTALVIDTNIPGYFREEDRPSLEIAVREFAVRLSLEYAVSRLVSEIGP